MMVRRMMRRAGAAVFGITLALTLALPLSLAAQEVTADLTMLLAEAEASNPKLLAARKAAEAAAARVPQAGAPPDPMFNVGIMNLPAANPSLSGDMMTMMSVGFGTTLPFPGKLGLHEDIARYQADAAKWEVERVRQRVLTDVKSAHYEIYFLDRALGVAERNEALVADFAKLTSTRYGVGRGAQADVLRAQVERTGLEEQLVRLREQRTSAAARLNALLDRPTDARIPAAELEEEIRTAAEEPPGAGARTFAWAPGDDDRRAIVGGLSVADLQRLALENNPMVQAHARRIEARRKALELAGKARLPDVRLSASYGYRVDAGDLVSLMASVPVPLFSGRKQDQQVVEESAVLAEHEATHHDMVNDLSARIARLAAEIRRARSQLVLLNDGILPQARASLESATSAYRVGSVDFLALLDSQVKLYRHELDYHRLMSDFATNVAALERAVGTEVLR